MLAGTVTFAQNQEQKEMVVHCNDGSTMRINLSEIDFIDYEDAETEYRKSVDLGLSVRWAECNVGANAPEDFGDYFAWGETLSKKSYTEATYKPSDASGFLNIGKNITATQYDAARTQWGGKWRMPTICEIDELTSRCTWTWTTFNGVNGYSIVGPSGNSIFLPAAGQYRDSKVVDSGTHGYYWSSTLSYDYPTAAFNLNFAGYSANWSANRSYGFCIRPVK